jgi:tight adherence protein B
VNQGYIVGLVTASVAVAIGLLAWVAIDAGSKGLARYRQAFDERTTFSLRELFLFIDPGRLFVLTAAMVALSGAATWLLSGSAFFGVVAAAGMACLPRMALRKLRRRRLDKLEQQLPDALLTIAGCMKAGVSMTQAVARLVAETQAPLSQEFDLVLREQRLGVAIDKALDNFSQRMPLQSVTLTVSAMRIATETGGQLAETLERASHTLRSKLAMEAKIRALTSQGKLQAVVVGALPLLLIVVLMQMEPEAMDLLFSTRMGWATLAVIATLEFFGILLIRKIVDIDV